jgi:hypothetical protein
MLYPGFQADDKYSNRQINQFMNKSLYLSALSILCIGMGMYFIYGKYQLYLYDDKALEVRHVLFSPGIALIGAGLYIAVRFVVLKKK